jgi:hypothetical protein
MSCATLYEKASSCVTASCSCDVRCSTRLSSSSFDLCSSAAAALKSVTSTQEPM